MCSRSRAERKHPIEFEITLVSISTSGLISRVKTIKWQLGLKTAKKDLGGLKIGRRCVRICRLRTIPESLELDLKEVDSIASTRSQSTARASTYTVFGLVRIRFFIACWWKLR